VTRADNTRISVPRAPTRRQLQILANRSTPKRMPMTNLDAEVAPDRMKLRTGP
jgi:hypothetical protein